MVTLPPLPPNTRTLITTKVRQQRHPIRVTKEGTPLPPPPRRQKCALSCENGRAFVYDTEVRRREESESREEASAEVARDHQIENGMS